MQKPSSKEGLDTTLVAASNANLGREEQKPAGSTVVPVTAADGDVNQPLLSRTATGPSNVAKFLGCLVQVPQAIGGALAGSAKWFWNHPTVSVMLLTGGVNGAAFAAVNGKLGTTAEEYSDKALGLVGDVNHMNRNAVAGLFAVSTTLGAGLAASVVSRVRADNAAEAERVSALVPTLSPR